MSGSRNTTESIPEEMMVTAVTTSPPGVWPSSLQRQSAWPTNQYDPFASAPSQRRSQGAFDLPQNRLLFDNRGFDRRPLVTQDNAPALPLQSHEDMPQVTSAVYSVQDATYPHGPEECLPHARRQSQDSYVLHAESPQSRTYSEYEFETGSRRTGDLSRGDSRYHTRRRPYNQDEFDGPSQLLPLPVPQQDHSRSQALPQLPVNLSIEEQDEIARRTNDILAQCAFHFIAKYQFPIPLERDKPSVRQASDREWTEWAYLLKRLATKRRIPARILYEGQIRQLVTVLENSITVRQPSTTRTGQPLSVRSPRCDRYMLQLVSSGIQVARILMDSLAMQQLDALYTRTEAVILERRVRPRPENRNF